jgi:two-component system response regulator YesN
LSGFHELMQLISEDVLLKILNSFAEATGLRAIIVDRDGKTLFPRDFGGGCTFCRMVKDNPVSARKCCGSYARAGEQAAQFGEPYIFRCHAGLVAFAAPIVANGEPVGSIICGQVLMWEPEDFFWEEIAEMTAGLGLDPTALKQAAEEMGVISGRKVQAAADLLFVMANQIVQGGMMALQQKKEIAMRQSQLGEEIRARKELEKKLEEVEGRVFGHYSLQKEKELLGMVRIGNRDRAYRLLSELVSEIMEKYITAPRMFKARMLELLVVLSRSAVEGGADLDELLELNYRYIEEILKTDAVDELSDWIFRVMDDFMARAFGGVDTKNMQIVGAATRYMRNNYDSTLTLNSIAQAVFISPFYLSHIFKEELNSTVMDYLTKVRMEEAKRLLRNPRLSIVDIAEKTGYSDPGYFTKVFKKSEGITPSDFKRHLM